MGLLQVYFVVDGVTSTGPSGKYRTYTPGDTHKDAPRGGKGAFTPANPRGGGSSKTTPAKPPAIVTAINKGAESQAREQNNLYYGTFASSQAQTYTSRIQSSSGYGYSTKTGYVQAYYEKPRASEKPATPTFAEQQAADKQILRDRVRQLGEAWRTPTTGAFRAEKKAVKVGYAAEKVVFSATARPLLTQTGRAVESFAQRPEQPMYQRDYGIKAGPTQQRYAAAFKDRITAETEGLGRSFRVQPGKQAAFTVASYGGGVVGGQAAGGLIGWGVRRTAATKGVTVALQRGRAAEFAGGAALGGLAAFDVATTPRGQLGPKIPQYLAGGAGFAKGYRSTVPTRVTEGATEWGDLRIRNIEGKRVSGYQVGKRSFSVEQLGITREVITQPATFIRTSGKTPQGAFIGTATTVSATPRPVGLFGPQRPTVQTDTFAAALKFNRASSTSFFRSQKTGQVVLGEVQRPNQLIGSNLYGVESTRYRAASFQPRGDNLFVTTTASGTQARSKLPYVKTKFLAARVTPTEIQPFPKSLTKGTVLTSFRGRRVAFAEQRSLGTIREAQGINLRFADRGFNLGRKTGLYTPEQKDAIGLDLALRGRRGQITAGKVRPVESTFKPTEALNRNPSRVAGLELLGAKTRVATGPRFAAAPQYGNRQATILNPGTISTFAPRTTKPTTALSAGTILAPDTITVPKTGTSFIPRFSTTTRTTTTPANYGGVTPLTPTTPPPTPFIGAPGVPLPLFGLGGGTGGERAGRYQSFRYAPSLTSVLFNVRGKKSRRVLTGFEVRPL